MKRSLAAAFLAAALAWPLAAGGAEPGVYRLTVDGLACPFCAYGIEKQLSAIEGVSAIEMDIGSGQVTLTMAGGGVLGEAAARKAVEAAGFSLRGFERVSGAP